MNGSSFAAPIEKRYFEDYVAGAVHEFGAIKVEQGEIIDFARRFDPQDFHTDPEAAKDTEIIDYRRILWSYLILAVRWPL